MIETDAFQARQGCAIHVRGPGEEAALCRLGPNCADNLSPDRRWNPIGLQAAEAGHARLHQAFEPVQPPRGHRFGDLGPLQPRIGDIQPIRRSPRIGQGTATAGGEPLLLALADGGIDRDPIDREVQPDMQSILRCRLRYPRDAVIGGSLPAQGGVQGFMIGGDEDVSACTWDERRRDAYDIEPHGPASREVGRPLGQRPRDQRMQVVDLRCHASRGSELSCGPPVSVANSSEMTMPYPVWGNPPIATVTFAAPHIHLTGRRAISQLSVKAGAMRLSLA